jgi:hypothetical protein
MVVRLRARVVRRTDFRRDDRVDKLLDGTVTHVAHETFLADALAKMRTEVNTVGDLFGDVFGDVFDEREQKAGADRLLVVQAGC